MSKILSVCYGGSLFLNASLAKSKGGLERLGRLAFTDTHDADYHFILTAIEAAGQRPTQKKRFDMAVFQPIRLSVCEMNFFGILPSPPPGYPHRRLCLLG